MSLVRYFFYSGATGITFLEEPLKAAQVTEWLTVIPGLSPGICTVALSKAIGAQPRAREPSKKAIPSAGNKRIGLAARVDTTASSLAIDAFPKGSRTSKTRYPPLGISGLGMPPGICTMAFSLVIRARTVSSLNKGGAAAGGGGFEALDLCPPLWWGPLAV